MYVCMNKNINESCASTTTDLVKTIFAIFTTVDFLRKSHLEFPYVVWWDILWFLLPANIEHA